MEEVRALVPSISTLDLLKNKNVIVADVKQEAESLAVT